MELHLALASDRSEETRAGGVHAHKGIFDLMVFVDLGCFFSNQTL